MSLMLEEIRQQPAVLEGILARPPAAVERLRARFAKDRPAMIAIAARGTSDNAALFGRYLFEITCGIPTLLAAPSVSTLYRRLSLPANALVLGISQSGESTDVNAYLEYARKTGALTAGITNDAGSTLATLAHEVLPTGAGTESSVAATKTYTAQIATLYCLSQALGSGIRDDDLRKIPAAADAQLSAADAIRDLARHYRDLAHAVVIGRGFGYANCCEFALKLMETSYVVATAFSGADFAHGPIAMVDKGFPAFVFAVPGPTLEGTAELVARLAGSGAETVGIGTAATLKDLRCAGRIEIRGAVPEAPGFPRDLLAPIPSIIPAQLFAAHLSSIRGLDPDHPRMLSKVTRTM